MPCVLCIQIASGKH